MNMAKLNQSDRSKKQNTITQSYIWFILPGVQYLMAVPMTDLIKERPLIIETTTKLFLAKFSTNEEKYIVYEQKNFFKEKRSETKIKAGKVTGIFQIVSVYLLPNLENEEQIRNYCTQYGIKILKAIEA